MSTTLVFLVHGMGIYDDDAKWADSWITALDKAAENPAYSFFAQAKKKPATDRFSKLVTLIPITYDNIFSKYLAKLATDSSNLKTALANSALPQLNSLAKYVPDSSEIAGSNARKKAVLDFFMEFVCDVLLYRFSELRIAAKGTVLVKMQDEYNKAVEAAKIDINKGPVNVHIICHSLGTRVTSDALRALQDESEGDAAARLPVSSHHAIANVSRLMELSGSKSIYESPLVLTSEGGPSGFYGQTSHYYHYLDPFTLIRRFDARKSVPPEPAYYGKQNACQVELTQYDGVLKNLKDIHSFETYIKDPAVHVPIFNAVLNDVIKISEAATATTAYVAGTKDARQIIPDFAKLIFPENPADPADDNSAFTLLKKYAIEAIS